MSPITGKWGSTLLRTFVKGRGVPTLTLAFSVFPVKIFEVIPSFSDFFKGARAAVQWLSKATANRTLQREIKVTGAGYTRSFAHLSIKNPVGHQGELSGGNGVGEEEFFQKYELL
jgi:hypothetical protein